jgi:hypothetical protein
MLVGQVESDVDKVICNDRKVTSAQEMLSQSNQRESQALLTGFAPSSGQIQYWR